MQLIHFAHIASKLKEIYHYQQSVYPNVFTGNTWQRLYKVLDRIFFLPYWRG